MNEEYANKLKVLRWVFIVYILSFICYFPMLAERLGIILPNELLYLKYLFVCIPVIITVIFLICEKNLKAYFTQMFSRKIAVNDILIWFIFMALGVLISYCYSIRTGIDVFQNAYPSIATLLTGLVYLFITGFVEETAWRGFLLERVSLERKSIRNIIIVGVIWTIWHIPMWVIRNSLGFEQILYLCVWTILVSFILGITHYQCKNILVVTGLHMLFNICYLAPIQYNIIILTIIIVIGTCIIKRKHKR